MKLELTARRRRESRNGNRFYTSRDMAIIKHDQMVQNAREKRGELVKTVYGAKGAEDIPLTGNRFIAICGCGVEGCFIHTWAEGQVFNFKRGADGNVVSADNPTPVEAHSQQYMREYQKFQTGPRQGVVLNGPNA